MEIRAIPPCEDTMGRLLCFDLRMRHTLHRRLLIDIRSSSVRYLRRYGMRSRRREPFRSGVGKELLELTSTGGETAVEFSFFAQHQPAISFLARYLFE